jgi:hypothetical protein
MQLRLKSEITLPRVRGAEAGFREALASRRWSDARLPARGYVGVGVACTTPFSDQLRRCSRFS